MPIWNLDFGKPLVQAPHWHHFCALRWLVWTVPGGSGAGPAPFASHLPSSSALTKCAPTAHVPRWGLAALKERHWNLVKYGWRSEGPPDWRIYLHETFLSHLLLESHLPRPCWRRGQDRSGSRTIEMDCSHLDSLELSRGGLHRRSHWKRPVSISLGPVHSLELSECSRTMNSGWLAPHPSNSLIQKLFIEYLLFGKLSFRCLGCIRE